MNLTQSLSKAQKSLSQEDLINRLKLLKNSQLYNQELQPTSEKLDEYLKINKLDDIDFSCEIFQNYLKKEILKI